MTRAQARRVHFVGIGGAGMSAVAKVLLERGTAVSGSDLKPSSATTVLEAMGARVQIGHSAEAVNGADLVVVSSAIPDSNPELRQARTRGLAILTRGEALAELLAGHRTIVVAGTHGKTTTTSMIVCALLEAGMDPTYLVGGGLNDVGTNARAGEGDVAVAESDESDGSFLLLDPYVAVITNVDEDHLDYWGGIDELRTSFERFATSVPGDGAAVVSADDPLAAIVEAAGRRVVRFGPSGDVWAENVEPRPGGTSFDLVTSRGSHPVELRVPGAHNVTNALAAAAACVAVDVDARMIASGLSSYKGVERRFQIRGEARGVTVIDDYAHHPTEVRATLAATRPGPWRRVVAVFQPHRYSRTAALYDDFGSSFEEADRVVVTEVYGAGELPVPGVTGKLVSDAACRHLPGRAVAYLPHRAELLAYLEAVTRSGDALMTLGAGDISTVGEEFLVRLGGPE